MNLQELLLNNSAQDLVIIQDSRPMTLSLKVARYFEKEHKHVIRDIREKILPNVSEDFGRSNFGLSSYLNEQNKEQPMYTLTRDGFTMVAMGYTGNRAMKFKENYITEFNKMEEALRIKINPLSQEEIICRAAEKLAGDLFPQFMKTVTTQINHLIAFRTTNTEDLPIVLKVIDVKNIMGIGMVQAYKLVNKDDFPLLRVGRRLCIPRDRFLEWLNDSNKTADGGI